MDVDRILLKKVSEVSFSRSGHRLQCSFWKRITGKEPKGVTPDLNAVTRETQYKTAQTQGGEASRPANEHRNRWGTSRIKCPGRVA